MLKCPVPKCDGFIKTLRISHTRQYRVNDDDTIEPIAFMGEEEYVDVKYNCSDSMFHENKNGCSPKEARPFIWELPEVYWLQLPDDLKQASDRLKKKDKV